MRKKELVRFLKSSNLSDEATVVINHKLASGEEIEVPVRSLEQVGLNTGRRKLFLSNKQPKLSKMHKVDPNVMPINFGRFHKCIKCKEWLDEKRMKTEQCCVSNPKCYLEEYGDSWGVSFGMPNGEKGIDFENKAMAVECVFNYNFDKVISTSIPFHPEECCGCCDLYFSTIQQEIILICNECGSIRKAMFNDPEILDIYGVTLPLKTN